MGLDVTRDIVEPPVAAAVASAPPQDRAVAADIASDAAGEVRNGASPLPPPGTSWEGFWQRSATHGAIILTVGLGLMFARAAILGEPVSREGTAVAVEAVVWGWLAAIGIRAVGGMGLREK